MLLVIFGAGASYDSTPLDPPAPARRPGNDSRPPLANEIFGSRFLHHQDEFPHFKPLVPFLHAPRSSMEEVLEKLLSESADDPRRHAEFFAIRHYLPRVIGDCEKTWLANHRRVTNHLSLLGRIELWRKRRHERVCLVTFNYDTIIEAALADRFNIQVERMRDYIGSDDYKLIKLHGSTTWFHRVLYPTVTSTYVATELIERAEEVQLEPEFKILPWDTRGRSPDGGPVVVPAVAMPVAKKTDFECPSDHVEALQLALPSVSKLILVGWRAQEQRFLDMLRESLSASADAIVVGKDEADAKTIVSWIREQNVPGNYEPAGYSGFTSFLLSETVDTFLER